MGKDRKVFMMLRLFSAAYWSLLKVKIAYIVRFADMNEDRGSIICSTKITFAYSINVFCL